MPPSVKRVADGDAEFLREALAGGDAPGVAVAGEDAGSGDVAVEGETADERERAVDAAHIDLHDFVAAAGHQVDLGGVAHLPARIHPGALFGAGVALGERDGGVAAEQLVRLAAEAGLQGVGDGTRRRDGPRAERETGEIDPEARDAAGRVRAGRCGARADEAGVR